MLSSAATFSFFLAIGSVRLLFLLAAMITSCRAKVIRTDGQLGTSPYAARMQLLPPLVASRAEGVALLKARWAEEKRREDLYKSS
jgi:hypothetical protein